MFGTYAIPGPGMFAIIKGADGPDILLKDGASEPLYASGPDTFFILSSDRVLHVTGDGAPVSGRIVTGPFDVPFRKEG